jgi:hypothetical protein
MFDTALVRTLLGELQTAAPGVSLNRPIKERELLAWEREHGVQVPTEYRTFLLEFGNGGAGPGFGLWPLGKWAPMRDALEAIAPSLGDLRAAFPHRDAWNLSDERINPPDFDTLDEEDAWGDARDAEYFAASLVNGAFWICHHGCAIYSMLVVTGAERGNVWRDGRGEYTGISPYTTDDGKRLSFGDWYLDWLEAEVRAARTA